MKESEKIVVQLLGRALFNNEVQLPKNIDWEEVYKEAKLQSIPLIIYDCITNDERSDMPQSVQIAWQRLIAANIYSNEKLLTEQSVVLKILKENLIPCVILKGSSSAINYPKPYLRSMGDIDLLVNPSQQMTAVQILQEHGYGDILCEEHHCHMTISKDGVVVEVHKEPNGLHMDEKAKVAVKLREFFTDAVEKRRYVNELPILSVEHQAVVLILHKLEHFLSGGLGLRQLCDWAVFVQNQLNEAVWRNLEPKLREFGLLTFTEIITRVCIDYLSLPEDSAKWAMSSDKKLAYEVMERILSSGNFGVKETTYGERYFVNVNASNRITSFLKVLISACKLHWPVCEKHSILMPIAPFVIYGKYLKLHKEGKRDKLRVAQMFKQAGPKQKLFKELRPFMIQDDSFEKITNN